MKEPRKIIFRVRLNERERKRLYELAEEKGLSAADFIRFELLYNPKEPKQKKEYKDHEK
jgi:hypothetical protein